MSFPAVGEAATQLPWLCPCASSLLALARKPAAAAWKEVRADPGAVLLILREAPLRFYSARESIFPGLLRDPVILKGALRILAQTVPELEPVGATESTGAIPLAPCPAWERPPIPGGFVDWSRPDCRPVYQACLSYARTAEGLAEITRRCDPHLAWVAGLLAPLGWLAVCAIDPIHASACRADPAFPHDPIFIQQQRWGYDHAAIARRLARRWRLPDRLSVLVGHLGLPSDLAHSLGADPDLFPMVQLAVGLVQQRDPGLRLAIGTDLAAIATAFGLSPAELTEKYREWDREHTYAESTKREGGWTSPHGLPLLPDVLSLSVENLQLHDSLTVDQLERERDRLHQALEHQRHGEAERLQALKLNALAEFAAGAAHEINNPLAVISGQAQYLLGREAEPDRQRALQTINGQAHRIHQLLNELMQFARPPRPRKQLVDLRGLLREVALSLSDLAAQRHVELVCLDPDSELTLHADPRLLRTALECLFRNAIEAAPPGGWAGIRVGLSSGDSLEFVVEDNGPGPAPSQRDHLFDPFYSGRLAGRGRGFGLPTAWRLVREHGGDVRFDRPVDGPTQFILSLPRGSSKNPLSSEICEAQNGHEPSDHCPLPSPHLHADNHKGPDTLRQAV
ncbi:MAG TPA: HAMP domain-containing sensor histidine kinase [Gemmataceae bacterium]|nr:HAMP domain-containing sensor histidine kinase [Gemmataceae bacterium]